MKRYRVAALLLALILLFCSCSPRTTTPPVNTGEPSQTTGSETGGSTGPDTPKPPQYEEGTYTLLIYLCGSNLETRSGAATKNIAEMLAATIPENTSVILQTGGAAKWRNYDISAKHSNRYEIKNGELVLIEQGTPKNMGLTSTLADFLFWGEAHYPAERRGLILWDHGGGSMKGVCTDEQFYNDALTLQEMYSALMLVQGESGRKYEFIGFDACLMATYDTACYTAPFAHYMIASEELEPATGWNYTTLLSHLGAEDFYTALLRAYGEKQSEKSSHTLSVIDLSRMADIDRTVSQIAQCLKERPWMMKQVLVNGIEFGADTLLGGNTNIFDLGVVAQTLSINHSFSEFIQTENGAVHAKATGISLYMPVEQTKLVEEYQRVCMNGEYIDFLLHYQYVEPENPIVFRDKGYNNNGNFSFILTPESEQYIQSVGYILISREQNETMDLPYCVGVDSDVIFENGIYTVDFDGRWVFLGGMPLHTEIYENENKNTVFSTTVKINGEICLLLFVYSAKNQSINVEGYMILDDVTSRIHDLQDGMEITALYTTFDEATGHEYHEVGSVIWGDSVSVSISTLHAGYYQCVPYIFDIYGNLYLGNTAQIYFDGEQCTLDQIIFN